MNRIRIAVIAALQQVRITYRRCAVNARRRIPATRLAGPNSTGLCNQRSVISMYSAVFELVLTLPLPRRPFWVPAVQGRIAAIHPDFDRG
jgi:hypothetical protein